MPTQKKTVQPSARADRRARRVREPLERGADDIPFLASRAATRPLDPEQAACRVREVMNEVRSGDRIAGARMLHEGRMLIDLYMRHVDAALGFTSWVRFLQAHWPLTDRHAWRRMRLASVATEAEVRRFGATVSLLGARLCEVLGLPTLQRLERVSLQLHSADGGGKVRFGEASTRQLESVLRRLVHGDPAEREETLVDTMRRYRSTIDEIIAQDEPVRAIRPVVYAHEGKAFVRVRTSGLDEIRAAERLYRKLARSGS